MRKQYFGIHSLLKGGAILCLCLVLAGAIVSTSFEGTAGAASKGPLPEIKSFTADPMTLKDTESAVYKFEVSGATSLELVEAGSLLKLISGPPDATIKGSVRGMTPNQFRTGDSKEFNAVLRAGNGNGTTSKMLTLTYATVRQPKLEPSTGQTGAVENKTDSRVPKWLPQFSSPVSLTPSTAYSASTWPPPFATCPGDCKKCLRPDQATALGLSQKCLEQPCYYSPDKQQNWYCYKPGAGWCCKNGKYSQATKEECSKAGGAWYATEAEVIKACQPATGWFCSGGKVYQGSPAQAAQVGAYLYTTEAEATKACGQQGYCCQNGRLTSATQTTCKEAGGTFYTDPNAAGQACQQQGYCCQNGRLTSATQTTCKDAGGIFYTDPNVAGQACQQSGYCCQNGRLTSATPTTCKEAGGTFYTDPNVAGQACQQPGYCCANGRLTSATPSTCKEAGGTFYTDPNVAGQACQPPGYCCVNGQLSTTTPSACKYAGGTFYTNATEARACYQQTACWCCAGGKVFQTTQSSCINSGGRCYTTQSQAQAACYRTTQPDLPIQPIRPYQPPTIK